jgi:hypothetical protein
MASGLGRTLALVFAARKRRAEVDWAAQVVGLSVLVQNWPESEGPMKRAPVLAEMSLLPVAVPVTVGTHWET